MADNYLVFFRIHLMQIKRMLGDLGIFRFLFLMVVLLMLMFAFLKAFSNEGNQELATGVLILLLATLQLQRGDREFLQIHFDNYRWILRSQYLVLSLPFLGLLIYAQNWLTSLLLVAVIFMIPHLKFKIKNRFQHFFAINWIPDDCFEWRSGLRKALPVVLLLLAGGLSFVYFTGAVPLALFVLGVLPLRFFEKGESFQMLMAKEQSASKLIWQKFRTHFVIFSLLSLPLMVVFLIFHVQLWYIVLAEYFLFLSLHFYVIAIKYAFYVPNEKPGAVEVFTSFGAFGIIIPVLLPVVWALTIWMFLRARRNLKPYLDDYSS